ncbi:MAG: methyltransferase domain-containing protein [Xanthomonadales bacterium]|nr:methyltransferase domain-containing protein [Xanthomonadales bacterium]
MIEPSGPRTCVHHDTGVCRSCSGWAQPYADQLHAKDRSCRDLLARFPNLQWDAPTASEPVHFRNKAKLAVGGTSAAPTLGVLGADLQGIDLPHCRLYVAAIEAALPAIRGFISEASLSPYDARARVGELKYVLLTASPDGRLMVRWVLRSREAEGRLRKHLPSLLASLPDLDVVSINLQPQPAAIVEGDEEVLLHGSTLRMRMPGADLHLRPGGFFQTNSDVAAELYTTAATWSAALGIERVIDLYCGIGGFALHLAGQGRSVSGYEIHPAAVDAARRSAADLEGPAPEFHCVDATTLPASVLGADLMVVNPPRRGLGARLCAQLADAAPPWLLYSSCNPQTLLADLERLHDYQPARARLFDLFPHTPHAEVLVLSRRAPDPAH